MIGSARPDLVARRVVERVRPWAAPLPAPDAPRVAVIGAGPAGLATAALLRRAGVRSIVLDRDDRVGSSWAHRYDSLRLNTVRWMSDLPGLRMDRSLGRWVRRDDLVDYLERYAAHHRLACRLGANGEISRIEAAGREWVVAGPAGRERFDAVVVATGHSRAPTMPTWAGAEHFAGRLLHASEYHSPDEHTGVRVLVVGAGSSGGEICVDLAGAGASADAGAGADDGVGDGSPVEVIWSVRSAPQVLPREVVGVPATPFAPVGDALPDAWVDRVVPWIERSIYGPRDYLPEPEEPMMRLLATCKEPMTADGIVELIRAGRVRVVDAVADLDATGARLVDGTRVEADHVIAATGYRTALEPIVGHLGVLDADGRPTGLLPRSGLAFVGFRIPLTGTLWAIERDARLAADAITRQLR